MRVTVADRLLAVGTVARALTACGGVSHGQRPKVVSRPLDHDALSG